ncbi:Calx-beta domain-containing protein, partial [Acinetobacter sp. YH16058]|uniref:Calx-beta domain-containing protein n=1 Tax=Acinetobacter sp. YH16058 TaxID=2601196 RepID=UPI001C55335F
MQQFAEQNTTLTDLEKLQEFAQQYKNIEFHESNDHIIRLEDGRIFKKSGKDYVEVQPELENITDNQGGHRFVQVAKLDQISIADGINPLILDRVVDNIPPLNTLYPTIDYPTTTDYAVPVVEKPVTTSKYHPQASVNDVYQYEGGELIHTVTISGQGNNPTKVIVTISNSNTDLGIDTGIIEYSTDGGKTWTSTHISEGSFEVNVPKGNSSFLVKIPSISDNVFEGPESYDISVSVPGQTTAGTGTGTIVDDGSDPNNPGQPGDPNDPDYDDDRPTASITSDTKYEGNDLIHNVTLSNPSESATTVTVTLSHDTTDGNDITTIQYTTDGGKTWQTATPNANGEFDVTVPKGGTDFQIRVGTNDDNVLEGRESYDISVKTPSQTTAGTGTGTIVDDGSAIPPTDPVTPPGTVTPPPGTPTDPNVPNDDRPSASINNASQYEGGDNIHTVTITGDSNSITPVTVTLTSGTA